MLLSTLKYFEILFHCVGIETLRNHEPIFLGALDAMVTKIILEPLPLELTLTYIYQILRQHMLSNSFSS